MTILSPPPPLAERDDDITVVEVLAAASARDRRRLARALRRVARQHVDGCVARHQTFPILRANVEERLVGSWERYRSAYLVPLAYVLGKGIRTGQPEYFNIYSAERTRFYDDDESSGREELEAVLSADRASWVKLIPDRGLGRLLDRILAAIDRGVMPQSAANVARIALIGDCLMTEIRAFLKPALATDGTILESSHFYFSARLGRDLHVAELEDAVTADRFDLLALSFFTFEGIPVYTSLLREAKELSRAEIEARCEGMIALVGTVVADIRKRTDATMILHGCSGLPLGHVRRYVPFVRPFSTSQALVAQTLNTGLGSLADASNNVLFVDEQALVASVGGREANRRLLPRRVTHTAVFHYSVLGRIFGDAYREIVRTHQALSRTKVLLVDFDNTLWSGVMGDGDVTHNQAAQVLLKELEESGILLVALSKNDPKTIRWHEMHLKSDDFVLQKISWQPKPQSVAEAAHELDLDPSSFVLVDDNPVERELVKAEFPTITTMDPTDGATWQQLSMMLSFPNTRRTAEAMRRTKMYQEAAGRRDVLRGNIDYPSMMRSLELRSEWRQATKADLNRVHELLSRTNQFNTTTMRLTVREVAELIDSRVTTVHVTTLGDKFGKLGIVGIVITRCTDGTLSFDSVVMSCRAMGFGLERLLLRGPIDAATAVERAVGRYIPTERNSPCANLFRDAGFEKSSGDEWTLDLSGVLPEVPDWLTVERR